LNARLRFLFQDNPMEATIATTPKKPTTKKPAAKKPAAKKAAKPALKTVKATAPKKAAAPAIQLSSAPISLWQKLPWAFNPSTHLKPA
jgi:hypothetical protein